MKLRNKICSALAFAALTIAPAGAQLSGQLGILDLEANGGINPATGNAWQAGDQYRLVFVTSMTRDAEQTDIAEYNTFAQDAANASSLGLSGASWKVIASSEDVNAKVNTSTDSGTGEAIFLVDGSTIVANDYADLWDGGLDNPINLDEGGNLREVRIFAGTTAGGATVTNRWMGTTTLSNNQLRVETGESFDTSGHWMQQYNSPPTASHSFYALSDPLTVSEPVIAFPLVITPNNPTSLFKLEWDSQAGMLYRVLSNTGLGTPIDTWSEVAADIAATPPSNTYNVDPLDPTLFYAVEEYPAPPVEVFAENFDTTMAGSLPAGWTTGTNPADNSSLTAWELGTPANVGPVPPGVPLPSAENCVATNIGANYEDPDIVPELGAAHSDIWLRSPEINLGAATEATLSFQQWTQIEQAPGDLDYGSLRILDAANSVLATLENRTIDGNTTGWEEYSMALPAGVFNEMGDTIIKVEWQFEADDIDSFAGWYIDDVAVTIP